MAKFLRTIASFILLGFMVGCTNLSAVRDTLKNQTVKISSFAPMKYATLKDMGTTEFELKNNDPVFQFDGGKLYIFEPPEAKQGSEPTFPRPSESHAEFDRKCLDQHL